MGRRGWKLRLSGRGLSEVEGRTVGEIDEIVVINLNVLGLSAHELESE